MYGISNPSKDRDVRNEHERVLALVQSDLFPQLSWMSSLKSLVFIMRGVRSYDSPTLFGLTDCIFQNFIHWLLHDRRPELERLWIPWYYREDCDTYLQLFSESSARLSSVRLNLSPDVGNLEVLDESIRQRIRYLQHLGGHIYFSRLGVAPDLKYFQGYCEDGYQVQ